MKYQLERVVNDKMYRFLVYTIAITKYSCPCYIYKIKESCNKIGYTGFLGDNREIFSISERDALDRGIDELMDILCTNNFN